MNKIIHSLENTVYNTSPRWWDTWYSTSFIGSVWDPRVSSCWHMAHNIEAVTGSGESAEGQAVFPSLTHTFNLLTAEAVFRSIFGRTSATVKKQKQAPSPIYSPESPRLQRGIWSGFPWWTPSPIHLCFHMIQDISQSMFYHSAPAHVTHLWGEQETELRR